MNKKQLQHRIHELESIVNNYEGTFLSKKQSETTYVSKERKIKTFSGRPKLDTDLSIDDWIDEITLVFQSRRYTDGEKIDLIYSHLEGEARDELKFRPNIRRDPELMLNCLRNAFGDHDSVTILQKHFFERVQGKDESIRQYSYALLDLFQKVVKKDDSVFSEKTLSEQFAQNLYDPYIRKEIKKIFRSRPQISFFELRDECILISEEEERYTASKSATTSSYLQPETTRKPETGTDTTSSVDKLMKIVEQQQNQIQSLTTMLSKANFSRNQRTSGSERVPTSNPDTGSSTKSVVDGAGQRTGSAYVERRKCFKCNVVGHIAVNCPRFQEAVNKQGNQNPLLPGVHQ